MYEQKNDVGGVSGSLIERAPEVSRGGNWYNPYKHIRQWQYRDSTGDLEHTSNHFEGGTQNQWDWPQRRYDPRLYLSKNWNEDTLYYKP